MVIDPRHLKPMRVKGLDEFIDGDTPCRRCGYSLKGLKRSGRCPECGQPIASTIKRGKARSDISAFPVSYLKALAAGMGICAVGCLGMPLAFAVLGILTGLESAGRISINVRMVSAACSAAAMLFGVVWYVGVLIITAAPGAGENAPKIGTDDPNFAWFDAALFSRLTQLAWPLCGVLLTAAALGPTSVKSVMETGAILAAGGGMLGYVAVGVRLIQLGRLTQDDHVLDQLGLFAWGTPVCGGIYLLSLLNIGGGVAGVLGSIIGLLSWVCICFLVYIVYVEFISLLDLGNTFRWAAKNTVSGMDRDQRLRQRAAEMARRAAMARDSGDASDEEHEALWDHRPSDPVFHPRPADVQPFDLAKDAPPPPPTPKRKPGQ